MTVGFRLRDPATGRVLLSSDDLGLLFLDQFTIGAETAVKRYPGMAGVELRVTVLGVNSMGSSTNVSISDSGADKVISIQADRPAWILITRE